MNLSSINSAYALKQYELLRQEALEIPLASRGQGFTLLISRGLTAWLRALSALQGNVEIQSAVSHLPSSTVLMPACLRSEIRGVLAGMILAQTREVHR